ncbi:hypothetical protein SLE2022_220150 [Rubroshorea leprosula]
MHWWKKMRRLRRVWVSVSSKFKPRKSKGGRGGGKGAACGGSDGGGSLLNLEDDVHTCEYKDVQVMWNLLNRHKLEHAEVATAAAFAKPIKCS